MNRAYSILEIKSVDDETRTIEGIATTPSTDRAGDIVEPKGAQFKLPIPLLYQHNARQPICHVISAKVTDTGIAIKAQIAQGVVPFIDEAWALIKGGLVRGLSIGFKPIEAEHIKDSFASRYLKWDWLELSAVTIPANAEASILSIKAIDDQILRTASGDSAKPVVVALTKPPGASGKSVALLKTPKEKTMATIREQIASFEATRQAKAARRNDIMSKSAEVGRTLEAPEVEEYDGLDIDIKSIDAHLVRLNALEAENVLKAVEVIPSPGVITQAPRAPITVKSNLPKGTAFVRMSMAIAASKGDYFRAVEHAKQWHDSTPEVEMMVKAAVAAGTTTDATWAGPLVVAKPLVDEFLELLRPKTLIGRIPGLRQVPFNISVPSMTNGGTYGWVGQALNKPVTSMAFATVLLTFAKAAGIIVLTEELVKFSSPSAELEVSNAMIAGISQFLDTQFTDPAIAAVANVSPASITNGAATAASSGVTGAAARADLAAAVAVFVAGNIPLDGAVWLMNDSNAFGLGLALNALGQPLFPGVGTDGGTLLGRPVIVSNNVGARIILVHAPSILFADDGGVSIDASREATVQMDSAPDEPTAATTVMVSLWQRNLVGLRAERFITWTRARTAAVRVITTASPYNGT
jgi:HK97 family phage major capsid protein/HK97 family phage prohead protease